MGRQNIVREVNGLAMSITRKTNNSRRAVNRRIEQGMFDMQQTARDFAPIDEGNLEDAIVARKVRQGRNVYEVFVDRDAPGSNGALGEDKKVGSYVDFVHDGVYKLGPNSEFKNQQVGGGVGPLFMDRAFRKHGEQIVRDARDAVSRELK